MAKASLFPLLLALSLFALDQAIKQLFLQGAQWHSSCLSLILAINKGVAFSLFSFLGEGLKYIQLLLIAAIAWFAYRERLLHTYRYEAATFFAAGLSNIFDRFAIGGVVDYIYWHCGFEFAIFNLADVLIDCAVLSVLWRNFRNNKAKVG
ncbi:MAG: signal peptidase II [Campylobacterales bacterium]